MIEDIKAKINDTITTNFLDVIDESPNHSNYSGQISHVKIIIASDDFVDKKLLQRHQLVYQAMGKYVEQIHAISIVAKTVEEWESPMIFNPHHHAPKGDSELFLPD